MIGSTSSMATAGTYGFVPEPPQGIIHAPNSPPQMKAFISHQEMQCSSQCWEKQERISRWAELQSRWDGARRDILELHDSLSCPVPVAGLEAATRASCRM